MPRIKTSQVELYYEERGSGPALLGIHGTPSSALLWREAAHRLAELGRCIIYDRRGFGQSERPVPFETTDLVDQVNDAAELLVALGATPAVVIGRSTGGLIALELARKHPELVRALVLLEPAFFSIDEEATLWSKNLREKILARSADNPDQASEAVLRIALGDDAWDSIPGELQQVLAEGSAAVLAEIRGVGLDLSERALTLSRAELAGIGQPTLLVTAEDSPPALNLVNRRLARWLPKVEQATVAGGHLIDPAHPTILAFISSVTRIV